MSEPIRSLQSSSTTSSTLSLLDSFELVHNGCELALTSPARRLLAYLALRRRPVIRDHAAEELWLHSSQQRALGSLRCALWRLRQPGCELVRVCGCHLLIAPHIEVDVHEAMAWAQRMIRACPDGEVIDSAGLGYGDILPDWYDDWVTLERERFRLLRAQALEELCERLRSAGRLAEALEAGLSVVRSEPLRESAHRALMRVHLAQGNTAEAVGLYRRFHERLDLQLGLAPSPQIRLVLAQAHM